MSNPLISEAERKVRESVPILEVPAVESFRIRPELSAIYMVRGEPLPFACFLKAPQEGVPLMVFGQGFQDRRHIELPRFQRMDWASRLKYNVLIFNDPTLFLRDDIGLGWCLGTKDYDVMPVLQKLVESVRDQLKITNKNLMFYGSSAGGFSSLMLASRFEDSSAVVNNPQTNVLAFKRGGVRQLLRLGFDDIPLEQAAELYGARMSFVERVRQGAYVPKIYYLQNFLDEDHYQDQMLPLLEVLRISAGRKQTIDNSRRLIVELYSDAKALHNPVGFDKINFCINSVRNWFE